PGGCRVRTKGRGGGPGELGSGEPLAEPPAPAEVRWRLRLGHALLPKLYLERPQSLMEVRRWQSTARGAGRSPRVHIARRPEPCCAPLGSPTTTAVSHRSEWARLGTRWRLE